MVKFIATAKAVIASDDARKIEDIAGEESQESGGKTISSKGSST